jgi:hypothetical protein
MKIKLILFLTLLLIIVMFLSYLFVQHSLKTTLPVGNEEMLSQMQLPAAEILPSRLSGNRAITIVKRPQKQNKVSPVPDSASKSVEDYSAPVIVESGPKAQDSSSVSRGGITKINKQPTPQQREEMKAKGTLIF